MKIICTFCLAACMFLACDFDKVPPANNCSLGINLGLPRAKIVSAIQAKLDSLDSYMSEKKKKEPGFNFWMCENFRSELEKLKLDFAGLPPLAEPVNGFNHVEAVLKNTLEDYGVDHYISVAESFCRGQQISVTATYSSPSNDSYKEKRLVQYNKKREYDTESDVFVTTYKGYKHVDVCPTEIYVAFCLQEKSPANPIDLSRLKSLYPDEKVVIEGVFDSFRLKSDKADVGQGVVRPEVLCAYLKDWTIISPKNDRQ